MTGHTAAYVFDALIAALCVAASCMVVLVSAAMSWPLYVPAGLVLPLSVLAAHAMIGAASHLRADG